MSRTRESVNVDGMRAGEARSPSLLSRPNHGSVRPALALLALGAGLALFSPAAAAAPCDANKLLAKARAAHHPDGAKLETFRGSGDLVLHTPHGLIRRRLVEFYAFPGKARLEYGSGPQVSVMATDGRRAWAIEGGQPHWADRGHFVVPERLRALGRLLADAVSAGGPECVEGAPEGRQRVLVSPDGKEMILLDIDARTGLVRRYEGESPGTAGKADILTVRLDDYRKVDGLWVAFALATALNGEPITSTELQSAEVNKALVPPLFARPEGTPGSPLKEL